MANKKTLDQLIMEVLQERRLKNDYPFDPDDLQDIFGSGRGKPYKHAKSDMGASNKGGVTDKLTKLASLDNPKDKVNQDDFDDAAVKSSTTDEYKAGKAIADYGRTRKIKKPAIAAYSGGTPVLSKYGNPRGKKALKEAVLKAVRSGEISDAQELFELLKSEYKTLPSGGRSAYRVAERAIAAAGTVTSAAQYDKTLKTLEAALSALDSEEMPISRPTMYTQPSGKGKFGQEIISSFNTVFKLNPPATTIKERVERISEISIAMVSGDQNKVTDLSFIRSLRAASAKKRAILSCIMVLDYIAAFGKYFDHGSGGYLYEAFCALISGGEVVGKDMGSGDFEIAVAGGGTLKGSSKYLRSGTAGEQALSGFGENTTTTYIVAQKEGDVTASKRTDRATSDPGELVLIDVYLGDVEFGSTTRNIKSQTGSLNFSTSGSNLKIQAPEGKEDFKIFVAKEKGTTFRKSLEDTMISEDNTIKGTYEMFRNFMAQTLKADNLTKKYIDSGKNDDGNHALTALQTADVMHVKLINDISTTGANTVGTIGTSQRSLTESKTKSIKDLDKLIEQVILEHINK
jgi:hypothetical protein